MEQVRASTGRFIKKSRFIQRLKSDTALKQYHEEQREKKARLEASVIETPPKCNVLGTRLVDIAYLAEQLKCDSCSEPLSLASIESESRRGLASVFSISCNKCSAVKKVYTSRKTPGVEGFALYDVNCKAALGSIDTGIGHEQMKKFFADMDIPPPTHNVLKRAEKRVGKSFVTTAEASFKEAIQLEKELTVALLNESISSPRKRPYVPNNGEEGIVYITVSYDFGWQKRGFDSKSGQGSMIGVLSKKLLGMDSLSMSCRLCNLGHDPADHDCSKNYTGSSKNMESTMGVRLMVDNPLLHEAGVRVGTLIGDDDACTFAAVQRLSTHTVIKLSDSNHVRKKFSTSLYKLVPVHSELGRPSVIPYLRKCFNYALDQNKENASATTQALLNIADHAFGSHDNCNMWCKAKTNPNYAHKSLPNGKPLKDTNLRAALREILQHFSSRITKVATDGSSQPNESVNHMVATRQPKSRHYAGSNSYKYRTASAACCKNLGSSYITTVYMDAGLPLGNITQEFRLREDKAHEKRAQKQKTVDCKRQRCARKEKKQRDNAKRERKEGISYQSGMAMDLPMDVDDGNSILPDDDSPLIIADTETTSFDPKADILQIAAKCGEKEFSKYMFPTQRINPHASAVNGFIVTEGSLFQRGAPVVTTPPRIAANELLTFIESCGPKAVLVGHNFVRFDFPKIMSWLQKQSLLHNFFERVSSVADTLPIISQKSIRKQDLLAKEYLTDDKWKDLINDAHDALADCRILDALLQHFEISRSHLLNSAQTIKTLLDRSAVLQKKKGTIITLQSLSDNVSKGMISKIAEAGITMDNLREVYKRSGREGVKLCLARSVQTKKGPKPCVTSSDRIIDAVTNCLIAESCTPPCS